MKITDEASDIGDFRIEWEVAEGNWPAPSFRAYEAVAATREGEITDVALRVHGFIKWDDCGHFTFGESAQNPGYLHICGPRYAEALAALLPRLFKRSAELWGDLHIDARGRDAHVPK